MSRVTYANTPATQAQEALRQRHQLRPVTPAEEGHGVNALPPGVYGFTYSPGLANAPLFAERRFRSYETHKLADGEVFVIGFATVETAADIESAAEGATVTIQPEPDEQSATLVQIPYSRMQRHRQYAAPNERGFTVTLLGA